MSLHAELPESKAKREQALRNILAARRRQVLGQRSGDQVRGVVMPRQRGHFSKESVDVLEVQESRHALYVTVPSGVSSEVAEEADGEPLTKIVPEPSLVEGIDAVTFKRAEPIKQSAVMKDLGYDEGTTSGPEVRHKPLLGASRTGYYPVNRNNSVMRMGKIGENDRRKNNKTTTMSESLYKHFRPVESNIPIEEMTQFLYFGQKLSPETQNTTSSNSLEVTPTLSPIVSSRRRFMKRFSTTTPVAIPRLEEIINEEMNIAVEKSTVERNKIPKLKNVFRSPSASSLYYRKSPVRPADPTIVSNVIGLPDTKNVSDGVERTKETNKTENKLSTESNPPIPETINGHSSGHTPGNLTRDSNVLAQTTRPTDVTEAENNHTLRIVVAETEAKMNNDSVNLTAPGGSPPVVLPAQQHVYAYTITNVTRLLRNYSGPGVSTKEEGEQQGPAPAGTTEISDGSSSGIVATRSRSDLSAGPAAEGVTTLEGDSVANSSGDHGPKSDSDAASRGATSTQTSLEVNKTASNVADSEVGESKSHDLGSSVFTDSNSKRKNEEGNLRDVDQRMLQKSASAVLNQRPSDEPVADRVIGQGTRRRDQPRGYYFRVLKNQRKHTTDESVTKESFIRTVEPNKTIQVQSNITIIANESLQSARPTDNAMRNQNSTVRPEYHQVVNGKRNFEENSDKITPDMLAEQTLRKYSDMSEHRVAAPDIQVLDVTMTPLEMTTLPQESRGDEKPPSFSQVSVTTRKVEVTSSKSDSSDGGASAMSSGGAPSPVEARSRTDDQKVETGESLPKETTRVQSTMPPSLFPVTPRILTSVNKDVNTVTSEESVTEVPIIRTTNVTEANRPFGIAEDLSPSEIQQMYRSSNGMTTLKPDVQLPGEGEGEGEGEAEMRVAKFNASLSASENWNGQRTVSVERSPEVKGRNLSDKSRDKDDILPIMHLYNTTSIFNETSSIATSPSTHGTETQGVILPVVEVKDETSKKDSDSVTMNLPTASSGSVYGGENVAKNKIHDNVASPDRNPDPQRLPDSLLNNRDNSTRQKEDQGYREPVGPSYSNKGNNSQAGVGSNRTRQRPHQASPLPNNRFNNSAFDPTSNMTNFGASMLSPSIGDPVNVSEVILTRHEGENIATQETVAVVSYILATLVVFPIAVGVGLILRRLIMKNRKVRNTYLKLKFSLLCWFLYYS